MIFRHGAYFGALLLLLWPASAVAHILGAGGTSTLELHDWLHRWPQLVAVVAIVVFIDGFFLRLVLRARRESREAED